MQNQRVMSRETPNLAAGVIPRGQVDPHDGPACSAGGGLNVFSTRRQVTPQAVIDDLLALMAKQAATIHQLTKRSNDLTDELQRVTDLIDDILYDAEFQPVDASGHRITGRELYLTDHPLVECHVPALRQWFVNQAESTIDEMDNKR